MSIYMQCIVYFLIKVKYPVTLIVKNNKKLLIGTCTCIVISEIQQFIND